MWRNTQRKWQRQSESRKDSEIRCREIHTASGERPAPFPELYEFSFAETGYCAIIVPGDMVGIQHPVKMDLQE